MSDELCLNAVGPVWKLDGETWICERPHGHEGDHAAGDTWWTDAPEEARE